MADESIFCRWEGRSFPPEEFKHYAEYGLVHEHPPHDAPKHTTSGQPLPDQDGAVATWSVPSSMYRG